MSLTLPKRSFLALVAIGWADGSLQPMVQPQSVVVDREFYPGGGGLFSTASAIN